MYREDCEQGNNYQDNVNNNNNAKEKKKERKYSKSSLKTYPIRIHDSFLRIFF